MSCYADIQVERALRNLSAQMDRAAAASARRLLDDLLCAADGHWRTAEEAAEDVKDFLDRYEESKPNALAEARLLLEASLEEARSGERS